jgi:hypothetical protein
VSGGTLRTLPAPAGGKGGGGKIGEGHRLAAEALTAAGKIQAQTNFSPKTQIRPDFCWNSIV